MKIMTASGKSKILKSRNDKVHHKGLNLNVKSCRAVWKELSGACGTAWEQPGVLMHIILLPSSGHISPIVHHSGNSEVHSLKHSTDVAIRCDINVLNAAISMNSHLQGGINKDILCLKKRHLVCRLLMGFSTNC